MKKIKRIHDIIYLKENNYEKPKQLHAFICNLTKRSFNNSKNFDGTIVDFGSGNGELLFNLQKAFPKAKLNGIEINKSLVKMSSNKLKKNNIKIFSGSVLNKRIFKNNISDISVSCGVLPIFDDYKLYLNNLIKFTKKKGKIFIASLFNNFPLDVYVKYQRSKDYKKNFLESGWNIFSKKTILKFLKKNKKIKKVYYKDFQIRKNLKKNINDPVRSWTFRNRNGKLITTNGLSLILPTSILCIELK